MQEALEIAKDVVRWWWELLYPAHLLNVCHGEPDWTVLQSFTAKPLEANSWQTPRSPALYIWGSSQEPQRSQKTPKNYWHAASVGLCGCWCGRVRTTLHRPSAPGRAVAEVAGLPAVTWVALMVWREGDGTGTCLLQVRAVLGPELDCSDHLSTF